MLYISELLKYIADTNEEKLKDYYNKSFDNLKSLNTRSNVITVFILILLVCGNFPDLVNEDRVSGFKVSSDLITYVSPLLLSFFSLEWCLLARRRRELVRAMREMAYKLFGTPRLEKAGDTFEVSILNRNIIPAWLLVEILNVDKGTHSYDVLFRYMARAIPWVVVFFVGRSFFISFFRPHLPLMVVFCNLLGLFCWVMIIVFYKSEFKYLRPSRRVSE